MASNNPGSTATGGLAQAGAGPSFLRKYKPDQGKWTRLGSFAGAGAMVAWGAVWLHEQLSVFEGDTVVALLVTKGIPILFAVVLASVAWWAVYSSRGSGDFMIATEGEMKKVNWTTKREIIGSTKVVILFTVLMSILLFMCDFLFQQLFVWIGILKT